MTQRIIKAPQGLAEYREKTARFEKDIADWHAVITGTDYDDVK